MFNTDRSNNKHLRSSLLSKNEELISRFRSNKKDDVYHNSISKQSARKAVDINEPLQSKRLTQHRAERTTTKLGNFQRTNVSFTILACFKGMPEMP